MKFTLTSGTFAVGDVISFTCACTTSNKTGKGVAIQTSPVITVTGDFPKNESNTISYTVAVNDGVAGESSFSIKRNDSDIKFGTVSVTRADAGGEPVCPETLTITSKDSKTAFLEGDAIELTAALSEGNGAITYQWYKGGTAEGNKLAGKTAAKLEIASCVEGDAGDYYCVASKSDCSDAVNADAFTITVTHNPCVTHHWFVATDDATANSKTNWSGFTNAPTGSKNQDNSVTIDGTTYTLKKRTDSTGKESTILGFTIPAGKVGTLYGYMKSSGSTGRTLSLKKDDDVIKTNTEITGSSWTLITIDAIAPGTYTLSPDQNVQVQMFVLKICDATFHTIAFDSDGGSSVAEQSVLDGTTAIQPTDPTWEHHRFDGWYNGATPYDWTANVTGDLTLTAHWTQLYTITYASGDGTATGDAPTQVDKAEGETFTVAANTFEVAGKDFVKWNDGANDYASGATYTVGTDNIVLTAQWKAQADKYTVKFMDGETVLDTKVVEVGSHPADIEHPTKPLYTFAAWQLSGSDVNLDEVSGTKDDIVILTARWTAAYALNVNFKEAATQDLGVETALNTYHYASDASDISFEEKGLKIKTNAARFYFNVAPGKVAEIKFGNISGATYSVDGGAAETLTSSQLKATYSASAQSCVMTMTTAAYNIVEKVTIHDPFTVKFDANGGDDVAAVQGKPSITLPEPTNGTMNFKGWYDAETGGNLIGVAGASYTPTGNIELHAQWEAQSTINTLSDLKVNGETVLGFAANEHTYRMVLPYKSALPMITSATPTNANAKVALWPVDGPEWTDEYDGGCYRQQVVVTPQDPAAEKGYYDIRITIAPKDGVSIISIAVPNGNGNAQTIAAANITGYIGGTATQKLQNGGTKLGSNGHYIGFTLANSETLKEGDVIRLNVSAINGASHLTLYQNASDANLVKDIEWAATTGVNLIPLPAEAAGLSTLYIYRKSDVCNPSLSEFTILRPTNPVLTAITFDGVAGVIDEANKKVTVELPFSSDVASMIVEPTIAWNAPAATNAIVVNDGSGWVIDDDNTYVLTDKDGDQTTYTITLTQAAASADATLKTLTIKGNALTLVDGVYEYDYELPYGTTTAPEVEAEANDANANAVVTSVSLTEAVITVTAENGATQEYVINFTISPWQNIVIWDGSTMDAVAASPDASGLTWEVNGFGDIANYTTTCGSKTYSKVLPSGGGASNSRNFKIVIPDGYLAKFYIAFASHSDGELRGMSIGTTINKNLDTSIYGAECNTRSEALGGTSVIVGAGTYYINPIASIDFSEVSVLLRPGYIRPGLTVGSLGTICLPSNVPAGHAFGATFYELKGKETQYGKIVFDEILSGELAEGVPYLFQAQSDVLYCFYGTKSATEPDNSGAMKGTFEDMTLTNLTNIYYFAQKALWSCVDLTSLSVPANRAYVKMDEMPDITESNPAPGRRRITLGVNGQQVATGVDQVQGDEVPTKMIINGQLFILRGEKMYDAQGKLVK